MTDIDLSGETEPTNQMLERDEQALERAQDTENEREPDETGEMVTDTFDVADAVQRLQEE